MKNKIILLFATWLYCHAAMAQEKVLAADFSGGTCNFIVADVTKPVGGTSVWTQNSDYGMVASGYVGGRNYASESWLISPIVDLQNLVHSRMSISHAVNFFSSIDKAREETEVCIRIVGGDWVKLSSLCYPAKQSWNFVYCDDLDLSSFDGQCIQIGLHYVSTATKAGTWEVKSLTVTAETNVIAVGSLDALSEVEEGSAVVVNFSEAGAGMIDFSGIVSGTKPSAVSVGYSEAYVHDATGAVMLHNFLPQDPGWHAANGGALIGRLEGRYTVRNGVPGIEPTSYSNADNILCLDEMFEPTPISVSLSDVLLPENSARYVRVENVRVELSGDVPYVVDGNSAVEIDNRYDADEVELRELDERHAYNVTGIVGGREDDEERSTVVVLHLLSAEATTTGIETIGNLQFTINSAGDIYDLQGRKVIDHSQFTIHSSDAPANSTLSTLHSQQLKPGIYIKDGKKFIVK